MTGELTNGYKEKVLHLEKQNDELFRRLLKIETQGCTMCALFQQQVADTRDDIKELKIEIKSLIKTVYYAAGGCGILLIALNLLVKFL